jgi:hypothetical protein
LLGGADSAASVYGRILGWGRRSGLPPAPNDTPCEYGRKLMDHFPKLEKEIDIIIEAFNREVYGEITTSEPVLSSICSALRRMRSPRHWPSRISGWFVQPPLQGLSFSSESIQADNAESHSY